VSELALPQARAGRPSGWWGTALFLATEVTLFGTLFGTFAYLRFKAVHWPPPGIPEPEVLSPVVLTCALALTSVPVQAALVSARAGRARRAVAALVLALVVQSGYLAAQLVLYARDVDRVEPHRTAYGSIVVTMLGVHAAHVAVGILLELWLAVRLAQGLTRYRVVGLASTALYWHVVNALAVLVLLVELSPRL